MKETPEERLERMRLEHNINLGNIDSEDNWYVGGYYVGYANTQYIPDWATLHVPPRFQEIWKLGLSDGAGDRENGW